MMMKKELTKCAIQIIILKMMLFANITLSQSTQTVSIQNNETIHSAIDFTQLEDLLDIFSIHEIGLKFSKIHASLNSECASDMTEYLNGLKQKALWALKMNDATGHPPTGYFWGNNFWMGSMTLCRYIYKKESKRYVSHDQNGNTGRVLIRGNGSFTEIDNKNPPFVPQYGTLKVVFTETYTTPNPRIIHVGICLPASCNRNDLIALTEATGNRFNSKTIEVVNVRFPGHDGYSMFSDPSFLIFFGVTMIVVILLSTGSAYDVYLKRKVKKALKGKAYIKDTQSDSSNVCTGLYIPSRSNGSNLNGNVRMELETTQLSLAEEILLSFSVPKNFEAICSKDVGEDTVSCIHGIKVISMLWIILGHTCMVGFLYSDNKGFMKIAEQSFVFQTVMNSVYSVDTFFFVSGFLVSFLYLRNNAKGNLKKFSKGLNEFTSQSLHLVGLISYRIARLAVPYLYMIGATFTVMKYYEIHSAFEIPTLDHVNCPKYWWRNILYINTFFPVQEMCMWWSWYLANDTQFFLVGAMFLIISVKHFKFSAFCLSAFMLSAWITTGFIEYTNSFDDHFELIDKIYDKPWTRFGPYLVGMLVGYYLCKIELNLQLSKVQIVTGWIVANVTMFTLVYGVHFFEMNHTVAALHSSLSHTVWALGLAWTVIACSTGNGGYIDGLLSAKCLYPFSRVTYCVYLVNPLTVRALLLNSDAPYHLDEFATTIVFFGQIGASFVFAFIVSLAFEAPVCALLRIFTKRSYSNH